MTRDRKSALKSNASSKTNPTESRSPRSIRFSDSEWEAIEKKAEKRDLPAAAFIRLAALNAAASENFGQSGSISPELVERIRHIDRGVFILATLKRNEMIHDCRREELDEIVQEAKRIQIDTDKKF